MEHEHDPIEELDPSDAVPDGDAPNPGENLPEPDPDHVIEEPPGEKS